MLNQLLLCVQTIGGEESVKTVILGEANLFLPRNLLERQENGMTSSSRMTSSMHSEPYSAVLVFNLIKGDHEPVQNENSIEFTTIKLKRKSLRRGRF